MLKTNKNVMDVPYNEFCLTGPCSNVDVIASFQLVDVVKVNIDSDSDAASISDVRYMYFHHVFCSVSVDVI